MLPKRLRVADDALAAFSLSLNHCNGNQQRHLRLRDHSLPLHAFAVGDEI